ncbi:MAG: cbb3-type cytochrome c oxidase subunit 3 [Gammaproteobacteria bacterium]|nr:cbb3-type cytochrome c oxidase subunit 3 [Gammaproteobacteria bacterium]
MDAGTWRGVFTALMLLLFIGVCFWAYSSRRKKDFDEAAQLPLEPDSNEVHGSPRQPRA